MHHANAPTNTNTVIGLLTLALICTPAGCKEGAGTGVSAPRTLPAFAPEFVPWAVSSRARDKAAEGAVAMSKGDLERARGLLTEAVSLDPSWIDARLDLTRLYLRAGHAATAAELLLPLAKGGADCGGCIDAFDRIVGQPEFAGFFASDAGEGLLGQLPKTALDWRGWANGFARALVAMDAATLRSHVHPLEPFTLVRSCPECSNPARRKADEHLLRGDMAAVKLAARFNTVRPRLDTVPLRLHGEPTCKDRCCTWQTPAHITVGEAALAQVCFRPVNASRAALTRVQVIYGQSVNDREQVEAAERRRRQIEGVALPIQATPATTRPR